MGTTAGWREMASKELLRYHSLDNEQKDLEAHAQTIKKLSFGLRLLPLVLFLSYLTFTVLLFAFGPWPWPAVNRAELYLFLGTAHLALTLGYLSAATMTPHGYHGQWKIERIMTISLIANLALLVPTSAFRTGSGIPDVLAGLANPGAAYFASNAWRAEGGALVEYVRILLGPLLVLLYPLTIYYWSRLRWGVRLLSLLSILGFLAIYIATGTNKTIADYALLLPFLVFASYFAGLRRLRWRNIAIMAIIGVFLLALFLSFFASGQVSRIGSREGVHYFTLLGIQADASNALVRHLPAEARTGAIALSNYLTQGYYALSLTLEEPFVPMWGVGNSFFLYFNAAEITGLSEIQEMPYPVRLQKRGRWDAYGKWSTIYPWIASDVSFPGTILVVLIIGRLFALSWLDTLRGHNPFAVAVFSQFVIMLFYFSANNQVVQTGEALTGFYGSLVLWGWTRKKYVWRST